MFQPWLKPLAALLLEEDCIPVIRIPLCESMTMFVISPPYTLVGLFPWTSLGPCQYVKFISYLPLRELMA